MPGPKAARTTAAACSGRPWLASQSGDSGSVRRSGSMPKQGSALLNSIQRQAWGPESINR